MKYANLALLLASLAVVVGMWLGFKSGVLRGQEDTRAEAIKAGVGRYVADASTGAVRFEWGVSAAK